jgi:hypothetical protein
MTLAKLVKLPEGNYGYEENGIFITNPTLSKSGPVSPELNGFHIYGTGGGCTAWRREFQDKMYMLITNGDLGHNIEPDDECDFGVYQDDGNDELCLACWTMDEFELKCMYYL